MKFDEIIEKRHSVRKFLKKKPSWRDITLAMNSARLAPCAGNISTIYFLVVSDEEKINKLADAANQDWIKQAFFVVVACSKDEKLTLSYGDRGKTYARQQSGAALENFMLKLEDLGLSTCWVGAFYDEDIRRILKIPDGVEIEAMFPIGYAGEKTKQKPKPDLSTMVYWNQWENKYSEGTKKQEV